MPKRKTRLPAGHQDPRFLAWIRTLPCSVPGCKARFVEAAHTGPHGLAQKAPDRQAIPLCRAHHREGKNSLHQLGPREFQQRHRISLAEIVRRLNERPALKIVGGWYVAHVPGETHPVSIGQINIGLAHAIRCTTQYVREFRMREAS